MTDEEMRHYVPKKEHWIHNGTPDVSNAAGAYQINERTWRDAQRDWGITDFTPASQDKIAMHLISHDGAMDDVRKGDLTAAFAKLQRRWSSLPGASQSHHKDAEAFEKLDIFLKEELNK